MSHVFSLLVFDVFLPCLSSSDFRKKNFSIFFFPCLMLEVVHFFSSFPEKISQKKWPETPFFWYPFSIVQILASKSHNLPNFKGFFRFFELFLHHFFEVNFLCVLKFSNTSHFFFLTPGKKYVGPLFKKFPRYFLKKKKNFRQLFFRMKLVSQNGKCFQPKSLFFCTLCFLDVQNEMHISSDARKKKISA